VMNSCGNSSPSISVANQVIVFERDELDAQPTAGKSDSAARDANGGPYASQLSAGHSPDKASRTGPAGKLRKHDHPAI
jgi:hypothetical protein